MKLLPFAVFIFTFLGAGIYFDDFYALPAPVAMTLAIVSAFLVLKGTVAQKITLFLEGCGDKNILTMCMIYLLAGAFAAVSKSIGSVTAIVELGTNYLSPPFFAAGIFIMASFLSLASGTSVGTVVALGPIALGLAQSGGVDIHFIAAALLGGAMFGDNLSLISDTTIAATQLMGVKMVDKFKTNFSFVLPAALISVLLYYFLAPTNSQMHRVNQELAISFLTILPYLSVIGLSFLGLNVFTVLIIGIGLSSIIGIFNGQLSFLVLGKTIYEGFSSMNEIFLLSLFTGGLAHMIEQNGGMATLLNTFKQRMNGPKSALLGLGALVGLTDMATANNTVSIVITGKVAQKVSQEFEIEPKATASILDTFSCIVQGLLPYGAQILILSQYSKNTLSYPQLIQYSYYLLLLLIAVTLFIACGKIKALRK